MVDASDKKKRKRSVALLISAILGLAFFALVASRTFDLASQTLSSEAQTASDAGKQIGTIIGATILMPQIIVTGIAVIFNAVGWGTSSRGLTLTGAILYCVAAVLMVINAPFLLPSIVLSFVGYTRLKK